MRLKGQILTETGLAILFQVGRRKTWLPKAQIRLEPQDYRPGPHIVFLSRRLAESRFCGAEAAAADPGE